MSENTKSEVYTPWPDDEIDFVKGNWTIKRSRFEGLYDYTYNDIEAGAPADAFQLIEWGMAKLKTYSALLPWDAGELTFAEGAEIMRDLSDETATAKSGNYLAYVDGRYVKCNNFYLVHKKLAIPSESFLRKLSRGKPKLKKTEKIFWENDDLIIIPIDGVTVQKGAREGIYRVCRGGITYNYNAARVREEGFGVTSLEHKIMEREKHSSTTWKAYRAALHDFWLNENPDAIKTMRDVAIIWDGMEKNPNDPNLQRVLQHNGQIFEKIDKLLENVNYIRSKTEELDAIKSDYLRLVNEINESFNKLYQSYSSSLTVLTDLTDFDKKKSLVLGKISALANWKNNVSTISDEASVKYLFAMGEADNVGTPFPLTSIPQKFVKEDDDLCYKAATVATSSLKTEITDVYEAFKNKIAPLLSYDVSRDDIIKKLNMLVVNVNACKARREELKRFKSRELNDVDYSKKPGLFCRPHSYDRIKFTSNAKIKRESYSGYRVIGKFNSITVGRDDLIYLGLAIRI